MDALTKLTNSTNAKVTVKTTAKDADGTALAAAYVNSAVTVFDGTFPTVTGVKAVGSKALEITFSEPVWNGTSLTIANNEFKIKTGTYTYAVTSAVADGNIITVKTGTTLQEGDMVITYNNAASPTIQDFAGNKAFKGEYTYAYAKDTTAPVATIKSISQTEVVVAFDRPVYATDLTLYHSVSGVANYGVTHAAVTEPNAAKEWTFTFGDAKKIPAGTVNLFLKNSTVAANQITDLFGNKMADATFVEEITIDTTAPTVASTKLTGATTFAITFSENMDATESVKTANYSVTDADGKDVSFTVAYSAKVATLTFALTDNADYEVKVLAAKDEAGNAMASEYVEAINPGDNTAPDVSSTTVPYFTDANTIYVVFTEAMNGDQLIDKSFYMIDANSDGTYTALDADDSVEAISNKKVKITFADGGITAASDMRIGKMTDLAGKVLTDSATSYYTQITNITSDALTYTAEAIATNKIKLTFNKELAAFSNTEFAITGSDIDSIESMTVNADGVTEVVLVLTTGTVIAADAEPVVNTTAAPTETKSTEGTVLAAVTDNSIQAVDKIAPTVKDVVYVNDTTIKVVFTENLESTYFAATGKNGFGVAGGTATLTSAALVNPAADGDTVVLTGTNFTATTDITFSGAALYDVKAPGTTENKLADFTYTDSASNYTFTATTVQTAATYTVPVAAATTDPIITATTTANGAYGNEFTVVVATAATAGDGIEAELVGTVLTITHDTSLTSGDNTLASLKTAVEAAGPFTVTVAAGEVATVVAAGDALAAQSMAGGEDVVTVDASAVYTAADVNLADSNTDFALDNSGAVTFTATSVATDTDTITVTITAADAQVKGAMMNLKAGQLTVDANGYEFATTAVEVE